VVYVAPEAYDRVVDAIDRYAPELRPLLGTVLDIVLESLDDHEDIDSRRLYLAITNNHADPLSVVTLRKFLTALGRGYPQAA